MKGKNSNDKLNVFDIKANLLELNNLRENTSRVQKFLKATPIFAFDKKIDLGWQTENFKSIADLPGVSSLLFGEDGLNFEDAFYSYDDLYYSAFYFFSTNRLKT